VLKLLDGVKSLQQTENTQTMEKRQTELQLNNST